MNRGRSRDRDRDRDRARGGDRDNGRRRGSDDRRDKQRDNRGRQRSRSRSRDRRDRDRDRRRGSPSRHSRAQREERRAEERKRRDPFGRDVVREEVVPPTGSANSGPALSTNEVDAFLDEALQPETGAAPEAGAAPATSAGANVNGAPQTPALSSASEGVARVPDALLPWQRDRKIGKLGVEATDGRAPNAAMEQASPLLAPPLPSSAPPPAHTPVPPPPVHQQFPPPPDHPQFPPPPVHHQFPPPPVHHQLPPPPAPPLPPTSTAPYHPSLQPFANSSSVPPPVPPPGDVCAPPSNGGGETLTEAPMELSPLREDAPAPANNSRNNADDHDSFDSGSSSPRKNFKDEVGKVAQALLSKYFKAKRIASKEDYKFACRKVVKSIMYKERDGKFVFTSRTKMKVEKYIHEYVDRHSKDGGVFIRPA